jgi:Asp-tRNA(Asn)/Glu-tRNA(Gln) amidotransferase A subunit family amidase
MRATIHSFILLAAALCACAAQAAESKAFHLSETTIDGIHRGIRSGEVTCKQIVEGYIARAKAYDSGMCTTLVTADGAKVPAAMGTLRAGVPLQFPTTTVAITKLVPDFDKYTGLAPDFGRMERTESDPSVEQQFGMVAGIPNARQVDALESLNIRGERSVTCKGKFDAPPGTPLPADAPAGCEKFRRQPDALEYAAELDRKYGKNPDTKAMPLYCVPMSFKDVYDAKDIRSTGGGDVHYAMDVPPADGTIASRLRRAGAIIYAKAQNAEYNGGSGDPGGDAKVVHPYLGAGGSRDTWAGTACNPYDTQRITGGSSAGSGVSVAANLVVCSICESTGGSCRSPADHNNVVALVPTKGMISYAGAIGANPYQDHPGVLCRTVKDAATVLDALRDPQTGYFDPKDYYTALPHSFASKTPYVDALSKPGEKKPLAGMRIGVVRELFVKFTPADAAISDGVNRGLKVLKDLGAELVETTDPQYPDDPAIPNMKFTFQDAIAEVIPFQMPDVLSWKKKDGTPEFVVPGYDVTSRKYLVAAASHKAPWPANLNFRAIFGNPPAGMDPVTGYTFSFQFAQYLLERGDSRVHDWETLNANAKYYNDVRRVAMKNWENKAIDIRTHAVTYTIKRRDSLRMVMLKVMDQNKLDAFVNPVTTTLPEKIGGAGNRRGDAASAGPVGGRGGFGYGAMLGTAEVFVPAGFSDTIYDRKFALDKDGKKYETVDGTEPTKLGGAGLPYNMAFWAGPGDEAKLLKIASAYEEATHHRKAPPGFGPVKGEP